MKHILTLILLLATLTVAAQNNYSPCYTNNIAKGDAAFKQGKYSEAKTYYATAKQCNGGNPSVAQQKINSCDSKIKAQKEAAEAKRKAEQEAAEAKRKAEEEAKKKPQEFTVNGVTFKMIYVEGGTFTLGEGGKSSNQPQVTVSSFRMGETEVTQALWEAVMGDILLNPSHHKGENLPVDRVSWYNCQEFISKLNELTGKTFRLPTEAEWEYAARGGKYLSNYTYAGSNYIDEVAWYSKNSDSKSHPVKSKRPNALGLYDMSGNVEEWCSDWKGNYSASPQTDPSGPSSGWGRVKRGGSFFYYDEEEKYSVSYRNYSRPSFHDYTNGFRLVIDCLDAETKAKKEAEARQRAEAERKEEEAKKAACPRSVADYDGNKYATVYIASQCWMKENLRTTHYANGTSIPLGNETNTASGYCYYPDNNSNHVAKYGYLYNWFAVMNGSPSSDKVPSGVQGVCPIGWHVPSWMEWRYLYEYLRDQPQYRCGGNIENIGKALAATSGWSNSSNNCDIGNDPSSNNSTGFSALPAGFYNEKGYDGILRSAFFWTTNKFLEDKADACRLSNSSGEVDREYLYKYTGLSVRCVKD